MDANVPAVAVCAECHGYAEPPFTPLYNLFGRRTGWVVCLDCCAAILHPEAAERYDLGGEGG